MAGDSNQLTCEAFQNVIAELVGRGINVKDHPHAVACSGCRQLLQDLETIAEAARYRRFENDDDWPEAT